jgi:outer membrane immunogenic protein
MELGESDHDRYRPRAVRPGVSDRHHVVDQAQRIHGRRADRIQLSNGQLLIGLDADFDWSATKFKQDGTLGTLSFSTSYKNNYISTFGARFGYAFDRLLVYGKAGGAWTQDDFDLTASDGSELSGRFDRWGWMVGGGVEYAISHNWTVKAEYNYLDFGTKNEVLTPNATDLVTGSITADANDSKLTAHVVKIGVNYIFH